jgi:hypothetical protein
MSQALGKQPTRSRDLRAQTLVANYMPCARIGSELPFLGHIPFVWRVSRAQYAVESTVLLCRRCNRGVRAGLHGHGSSLKGYHAGLGTMKTKFPWDLCEDSTAVTILYGDLVLELSAQRWRSSGSWHILAVTRCSVNRRATITSEFVAQ